MLDKYKSIQIVMRKINPYKVHCSIYFDKNIYINLTGYENIKIHLIYFDSELVGIKCPMLLGS